MMIVISLHCVFVQTEKLIQPMKREGMIFGGFRTDSSLEMLKVFWRIRVPLDEDHFRAAARIRHVDIPFLIHGFSLKGKTVYASGELYKPLCEAAPLLAKRPESSHVERVNKTAIPCTGRGDADSEGVG